MEKEKEPCKDDRIEKYGEVTLDEGAQKHKIELISIIGEIEGHENLGGTSKITKYEHVIPQLARAEDDTGIDGVLILINTMGGDVEAGLAIAEMIASMTKPTVSLVLGGSHSIGVPIAVSAKCSYIVPSGTMMIHPVRMSGTVIGSSQTFANFLQIQKRITGFVCNHSRIKESRLEELMLETELLTKDMGTILVGEQAVKEGIIDKIGGIGDALCCLHEFIQDNDKQKRKTQDNDK